MAVAKALAARRIIAVDMCAHGEPKAITMTNSSCSNEDRLNFAKSYAATDIFLPPKKEASDKDNVAYSTRAAKKLQDDLKVASLGQESIDLVVDCTGAEVCCFRNLLPFANVCT